MLSAIKLVISENGKLLESLSKDTSTQPLHLIKNLEDFQQSANAVFTKLIETNGESGTIKLVILENGKLLESLSKDTSTQPSHLIKNLEDFQQSANAVLTKLIETKGESGALSHDTDNGEEHDEENEDEQVSTRKRKKHNKL